MAAIKSKIKDMMHKDHPSGTGHSSSSSAYPTNTTTSSSHNQGGVTGAVKGAVAGYDGTTSTGRGEGMNTTGEQDVRTGMSDLDISTGNNQDSMATGATTGLTGRHQHTNTSGITGGDRAYETTGSGSGYETGRTTGTGYEAGSTGGGISQGVTRSYDTTTNEVIDSERFTKTEDHEVVIEKKAYELEHRPVQKQYVVETRFEGERAVPGRATELLSTEAREVEERVVQMPHGEREIIVENVDLPLESEVVETHRVNLPHTHHQTSGTGTGLTDRLRDAAGAATTGTHGTATTSDTGTGSIGTGAGTSMTDTGIGGTGTSTPGTGTDAYGSNAGTTGAGSTY